MDDNNDDDDDESAYLHQGICLHPEIHIEINNLIVLSNNAVVN
jgi:hypothetical protein